MNTTPPCHTCCLAAIHKLVFITFRSTSHNRAACSHRHWRTLKTGPYLAAVIWLNIGSPMRTMLTRLPKSHVGGGPVRQNVHSSGLKHTPSCKHARCCKHTHTPTWDVSVAPARDGMPAIHSLQQGANRTFTKRSGRLVWQMPRTSKVRMKARERLKQPRANETAPCIKPPHAAHVSAA